MWAPEAELLPVSNIDTDGNENCASTFDVSKPPSPLCEAARMAALKKLRHKLTTLSSSATSESGGGNHKPPVLAFERWLARYALRRDEDDGDSDNDDDDEASSSPNDPLIPSDGFVDNALARDLARSAIPFDAAKTIATTLATEAREAATRIAQLHKSDASSTRHSQEVNVGECRKRARKEIKETLDVVKERAKAARLALEDADSKDDDPFVGQTLSELRSATSALDAAVSRAQREAIVKSASSETHGNGDNLSISISDSRRDGVFDVAILDGESGKPKRPYLTISKDHFRKLVRLWALAHGGDGAEISEPMHHMFQLPAEEQSALRRAIYCCLARYEALRGAGYQCAVPAGAFEAAAEACGLGRTIECFASPLNCRYRRFCSAFPDIEKAFGSLGSFFNDDDFNPTEGTFEANPPFVPETMELMRMKIEHMLSDRRRGPLSFLVVVPAWGAGIGFCKKLEVSSNMRCCARIPAADHAFYDGAQHNKATAGDAQDKEGTLLRPSSWDTAVILLQNEKGALKWPVSEKVLQTSFCAAMCNATKSIPEDSRTLEKWERRGVSRGGSSKQHGLKPKKDTQRKKKSADGGGVSTSSHAKRRKR